MQADAAKADAVAAKQRISELKQQLAERRAQEREVSSEVSGILGDADSAERQARSAHLTSPALLLWPSCDG